MQAFIDNSDLEKIVELQSKIEFTNEHLNSFNLDDEESVKEFSKYNEFLLTVVNASEQLFAKLKKIQENAKNTALNKLREQQEAINKRIQALEPKHEEKEKEKEMPSRRWSDMVSNDIPKGNKIVSFPSVPMLVKREVAPGARIDSILIDHEDGCRKHLGSVCYMEKTKKFYVCINDIVLTMCCGNILDEKDTPYKYRNYMPKGNGYEYDESNYRECNFYIPEIKSDVRHYTNRMKYVGASSQSYGNVQSITSYGIGSAKNLKGDLLSANSEQKMIASDMAGHWLLVGLYVKTFERNN
jgi:hypothetical protein